MEHYDRDDGHRPARRAARHEARHPGHARARQRRRDRQLVVDRRAQRVAVHDACTRRPRPGSSRSPRPAPSSTAPQGIRVNAICPGFIKTEIMGAALDQMPGTLEKAPLNRVGQAARGRRGRRVPRVGPRVVRDAARSSPSTAAAVACQTAPAERGPVRRRARRPGRGRAAAHRPRHLRRRRRAAGHAARVLRAQPVRPRPRSAAIDTSAALAAPGRARRVHRRRPQPRTSRSSGTRRSARRARRRRGRRSPRARCASSATRSRWSSPRRRYVAEDAAELVDVDYEPLPAGRRLHDAPSDADALVHEGHGSNVVGELDGLPGVGARRRVRGRRPRGRARRSTSRRTRRCRWRAAASSSTTRRATGELTIYAATQAPHEVRLFCSRLLGIPEHRIRVVMRDTGGGFGQKVLVQRDEMCLMLAAPKVGAPVKWVEDRRENLLAAGQVAPRARRRARWRSTPTARSRPRTSTSSRTAARTRRRGRSVPRPRSACCSPARTASRGRLRDHVASTRTPSAAPRTAGRGSSSRSPARCCSTSRPARWASTRSSCAGATCCGATSCRTRTRTA